VGDRWLITKTVKIGDYVIHASADDYLPVQHAFTIPGGTSPFTKTVSLGLRAVHTRIYAPIITRNQ
jgi:hypothetical protein